LLFRLAAGKRHANVRLRAQAVVMLKFMCFQVDFVRTSSYRLSMKFDFDADKNELLFQTRGVTFYQIIETIAESGVLLNVPHPNRDQYPNQWMFVIEHNQYTYCVPYVIDGDTYFLKTIFPNRKYMYLLSEQEQGNGS
jgi:uncharacterized DUF497 family protein